MEPVPSPNPIAVARVRAGLTQAELARRVGCSQQTLSGYERGSRPRSAAVVLRLCTALGVTKEELLGAAPLPEVPAGAEARLRVSTRSSVVRALGGSR